MEITVKLSLPRSLSPTTNPTGWIAAAGAIYAVAVMAYNAFHGDGILDPSVIAAAVGAVLALFARGSVTPLADPKDGAGRALTPDRGTLTYTSPANAPKTSTSSSGGGGGSQA